jgi:thymidylate kinase
VLIFIEGIDKAGKSTFAAALSARTSLPVYRKKVPALAPEDRYTYFKGVGYALLELHEIFHFPLIVDRPFISDWVYSGKTPAKRDISIWRDWEKRLTSKEAIIVYVEIPPNIFKARITAEPDPYMLLEDFETHVLLYEDYFEQTTFPVARIRGDVDFGEQLDQLRAWVITSCPEPQRTQLAGLIARLEP